MEKRKLGKSPLTIAPLVFGGNVFGWTIDEKTSFEVLDAFVEAGFNCIDTADAYSNWAPGNQGGESELIIGKWMKARANREQLVIATKVGSTIVRSKNKVLKKEYILKAVEDSLQRLQTDYIDLYQSHYDDVSTPVGETLEAYDILVKAGKVRVIGASNFSKERLEESIATSSQQGYPRYETLQPHYNLYDRQDFETNLAATCIAEEIGVITYYSLASGFLTGKYRTAADFSTTRGAGIKDYLNDRGIAILQALDEVAARHHATPAQISLAWLIARPSITAPIASATSVAQVKDIVQSVQVHLSAEDIEKLNTASAY
ncbi:aryl-alcohol dehydrogenase-like predicted oxidoreductase [Chitinophaga skermanii]|uniref:Aryl-alcohol dehydrogenase-like predicted oxidoreductase n=1 Tax=Chitinophaga skermanii TaxID=331697 RepID=A0A327QZP8_9BACT|nr:aldo/keto reductase [Chitinophaga skermanii]RAJ08923.1 aryl-alcohol dehydrogenase-like predicted oxidoreductase [Chitinophaga skermanii]